MPGMTRARPRQVRRAGRTCGVVCLFCMGLACPAAVVAAPRTDVVTLANGDRITGEVKGLEQGQLTLKTDAAGTIYIEWDKIVRLQTNQFLRVELDNGLRYFGQVPVAGADGTVAVVAEGDKEPSRIPMDHVVRLDPIEQGRLIKRLDGYITAGYDYTKANELQTFTFTGGLSSRSEVRQWALDGSSTVTSQQGNQDSSRWTVTGDWRYFLSKRWFAEGLAGMEANNELGLDLRALVGGALGRYLLQTQSQEWAAYVGLAYNRELYTGEPSQDSVEGLLGTQYSLFRYNTPEASLDAILNVFPSLTQSKRVRSEGKLRSRYEIIKDLFFEVSLYGSYDNEPGDRAQSNSDYGLTTSLGYSF